MTYQHPERKLRFAKLRVPAATQKERTAWSNFLEFANQLQAQGAMEVSPLLQLELDRLVAKGNPLAERFAEKLRVANVQERPAGTEAIPLPLNNPQRIRYLKWGKVE